MEEATHVTIATKGDEGDIFDSIEILECYCYPFDSA